MKAIIKIQTNPQRTVHLLGYGMTERAARVSAYSRVNNGNMYDDEYAGGTLVDISPRLAQILRDQSEDGLAMIGPVLNALRVVDGVLRTYSAGAGDI